MGTRGAVGFKYQDKYKITYNHFDSYPDCLGQAVVDFCKKIEEKKGWSKLKGRVKKVKLVNENDVPEEIDIGWYKEFSDLNVSSRKITDWYCLLRDTQGGVILDLIYEGRVGHMIDSYDFLLDSLFCEYAYIINLDDMTLEFYKGYQTKLDSKNPFGVKIITTTEPYTMEFLDGSVNKIPSKNYYPVKQVGKTSLLDIPDDWKSKYYSRDE